MKYNQMFIIGMKEKFMQKVLPTVEILVHLLILFQTGIAFWVVVEISER